MTDDDSDTLPMLDAATAAAHLEYLRRLELRDQVAGELAAIADAQAAKAAAKAAGLRLYTGKPCPRDHGNERRVSDNKCPQCAREATKASMRKKRGTRKVTVVHAGMQLRGNTLKQHMAAVAADVAAMSDDELRERAERRKR
jgi:hypothetical protein